MVNNKISQEIVDGLPEALDSCVHKTGDEVINGEKIFENNITAPNQKVIAFEKHRSIEVNGDTTINLQDTDEILDIRIATNSTITFDLGSINSPSSSFYTVQIKLRPAAGLTISLAVTGLTSGAAVVWVNGNVADLSDGKSHWIVLRIHGGKSYAVWSDAGSEG